MNILKTICLFFFFNSFGMHAKYPLFILNSPVGYSTFMMGVNSRFICVNDEVDPWNMADETKGRVEFVPLNESKMAFSRCFNFLPYPSKEEFFILSLMFYFELADDNSRRIVSRQLFDDFKALDTKNEELDFLLNKLSALKSDFSALKDLGVKYVFFMLKAIHNNKKKYLDIKKEVDEFLNQKNNYLDCSVDKNFGKVEGYFEWYYFALFLNSDNKFAELELYYNISFYLSKKIIELQIQILCKNSVTNIREYRDLIVFSQKKEEKQNEDAVSYKPETEPVSLNPHRAERRQYDQAATSDDSSESESLEEKRPAYKHIKHRNEDVVELIKSFESSSDKELIFANMGPHAGVFLYFIDIFKAFKMDEEGKKMDSKTVSIKPSDIYDKIKLLEDKNYKGTGRKYALRYKEGSFSLDFHQTHDGSSKTGYESGEFKAIKQLLGNVLSHIVEEGVS